MKDSTDPAAQAAAAGVEAERLFRVLWPGQLLPPLLWQWERLMAVVEVGVSLIR